ncbi:MAG: glycoside-pentoside-hexuronide (GPH):cation symporter [Anaerolineaceae bacterium]
MTTTLPSNTTKSLKLPLLTKLIYGSGDWGRASFNTLRQIFYAIFLTDVVGIDPRLASIAALVSTLWDAINDPLVGSISDKVRTRWGRRRPFLLFFSIPFAAAFIILWWAPPWKSQIALTITVTLAYMLADTIQTLVTVPYLALTPELAAEYDQRTSLTSYRMFFNLMASLATAVAAPIIVDAALKSGAGTQRGYMIVAALFGGLAALPFLLIFFRIKERPLDQEEIVERVNLQETIRILINNAPFRFATGIYVLNWISFDLVSLMLPYFLIYWINSGNMITQINLLGMNISLTSVVLGVLLIVAVAAIPVWSAIAQKFSKRWAYIVGMVFWIIVQLVIFSIQPGQITTIIILAALAGLSVSTAHIMPEAIFPDVIDWDEFRSHKRREGTYYGAVSFLRKLSSAAAIFLALQILGWFGYQAPPKNALLFAQSAQTVTAIRFLTGPVVAVLLLTAIFIAWRYPLSRERQHRIQKALIRRQERFATKKKERLDLQ